MIHEKRSWPPQGTTHHKTQSTELVEIRYKASRGENPPVPMDRMEPEYYACSLCDNWTWLNLTTPMAEVRNAFYNHLASHQDSSGCKVVTVWTISVPERSPLIKSKKHR